MEKGRIIFQIYEITRSTTSARRRSRGIEGDPGGSRKDEKTKQLTIQHYNEGGRDVDESSGRACGLVQPPRKERRGKRGRIDPLSFGVSTSPGRKKKKDQTIFALQQGGTS